MKSIVCYGIMLFFIGCVSEKENSNYPDCFRNVQSSVNLSMIGCGNIFAAVELDASKWVSVQLDENALELETKCQIFNIADFPDDIHIYYYTYAYHPDSIYFNFCSDIAFPPGTMGRTISWHAVSGKVSAVVSTHRAYRSPCDPFYASIKLTDVRFVKENSSQDTLIHELIIKDAVVGMCPG